MSRTNEGFSLIEVLITSVMVTAIALSTVPMFTRAMTNNTEGMDATKVANEARGHLERLLELPFSSAQLTLEGGAEKRTDEYFSTLDQVWSSVPLPTTDAAVFTRVTIVRQYGLQAIADGVLETAEALQFDAIPESVHLKEIEVRIEQTGAVFGRAKQLTLKTLKVK